MDVLRLMLLVNQFSGLVKVQYLKSAAWDEVYFLYADKHQSILQADTATFSEHG